MWIAFVLFTIVGLSVLVIVWGIRRLRALPAQTSAQPDLPRTTEFPLSKPKRAWELIALVAVVGVLIVGQLAFHWAKHQGWTTYTAADGLADNSASSIAVAPDGALWIGTVGGVSRFTGPVVSRGDGETWTTYTEDDGLASNRVRSIAVALDGALWFGTSKGVSHFDGKTWTLYTEDDGLTDNYVTSIAVAPDGVVWVGTVGGGVSRFNGAVWTTYTVYDGLASNAVTSIAVAPDGALWFGTAGDGVSRFDGEAWTTYTTADDLPANRVKGIAVAPDGTVWIGAYGSAVSRFDRGTWTTYTEDDRLAGNDIVSIAVAPDGRVWVGTWGGGVSCFADLAASTGDGGTWTTYTDSNSGLASGWVQSLDFDGQGRVWVGTAGGLSVFDERMSLSVQILQVWTIMRTLGIALLVLLASVWTVRRRSMLRARLSPVIAWIPRLVRGSRAWVGAILGALAIFPGLVWWAQSLGLVDWPLFDSSLGYIVVPLACLVLAGTGLVLSIKASGGDMKRQGIVGQVLNLLALLILAYLVCLALLWLLVVAFDLPIQ